MAKMRVLAVTNLYPTPTEPALGSFIEQQVAGLRETGVEVEVLFVDRRRHGATEYLSVPTRIRSRLRRFDADVVHIMYGGVMANVATRAIRSRPTVVTFHGTDLLGEHLSGVFRRLVAKCGVWSSWAAARRATGVVVVGKALREVLPDNVDRAKVRIIPCGIDLTRFRPLERSACRRQIGWSENNFHVLFNTSGDDPVKQPALARAAVETLKRAAVPAEIHELRGISNTEVPIWLNASDVLLLTSRTEGSPTIVKEALACNLPVVSVDVGDVGERIRDIEGCHLAAAEPGDLAEKLQLVYTGPRRVRSREKMEEVSVRQSAVQLKTFYEELTARA
jgi:glycosyltransferase involved in cell wall biosynthesis